MTKTSRMKLTNQTSHMLQNTTKHKTKQHVHEQQASVCCPACSLVKTDMACFVDPTDDLSASNSFKTVPASFARLASTLEEENTAWRKASM